MVNRLFLADRTEPATRLSVAVSLVVLLLTPCAAKALDEAGDLQLLEAITVSDGLSGYSVDYMGAGEPDRQDAPLALATGPGGYSVGYMGSGEPDRRDAPPAPATGPGGYSVGYMGSDEPDRRDAPSASTAEPSKPQAGVPGETAPARSTSASERLPASGPVDSGGSEETEWTWRNLLAGSRPKGDIRLAVVTGGSGCDAKKGNLTWTVSKICDGQESCELVLDDLMEAVSEVAPGCDPDLTLAWRCGSHPESFELQLGAGDVRGQRLRLTCGRESVALGTPEP